MPGCHHQPRHVLLLQRPRPFCTYPSMHEACRSRMTWEAALQYGATLHLFDPALPESLHRFLSHVYSTFLVPSRYRTATDDDGA
jgi:hypothetical protein